MEIKEIKSHLNILEVAKHLGIQINKDNKANCPFHNDKTPSLQFSPEKQIATCFSSNCNFGTQDLIGLTERKLNLTKHEALKYLSNLAGETESSIKKALSFGDGLGEVQYQTDFKQMQSSFLSSSTARTYAESRNLNWQAIEIGYNAFKNSRFNYLRGCITFGLKDKDNKIVSMYGRSVRDNDKAKHYYTANRKGLYPGYPPAETKTLILTESIIDAITLQNAITSTDAINRVSQQHHGSTAILALYGTNGLSLEHKQAIKNLPNLEEIILFLDGDEAGYSATEKYLEEFYNTYPKISLSIVETPENEDINSLTETYPNNYQEVITELINKRHKLTKQGIIDPKLVEKYCLFPLQNTKQKDTTANNTEEKEIIKNQCKSASELNTENKYKIIYTTENATYYIKGGLPKGLDNLKITLEIESVQTQFIASQRKSRTKLDLYEDKQTEKVSREAGEKLGIRSDLIELDLNYLTDLLDKYREEQIEENKPNEPTKQTLTPEEQDKAIRFLKQENLIKKLNKLIEKAGISGEENNRLFLFVIATSYKMYDTLHALIQGSSGSGKTYLSKQITDLMPKEDVIRLTRVTESSFYNFGEYEIQYKLIVLEDIDGLKEEAEYAFRELQSNGEIISGVSTKNENTGDFNTIRKIVKGPIGSIATTTRGEIYEDNMSRIFLLAVDEGKEQTDRIIKYLNQKSSGMINKIEETQTKHFIQNCVRMLKPYEVINPYANKILLPPEAHKIRRLTELYHAFINQITLINQYQRKKDTQGRLITEKEDVQIAIEIMFDSIILKIDELDGSLRQFYESLKEYIMKQGEEYKNYQFTQREIRQVLLISKTACQNNINKLVELEYINKTITSQRNTFHYKIEYWDSLQNLRSKIKTYLNNQLENL